MTFHWLPQWLLDIGSIAGLASLIFFIVDRLLKGRPSFAVSVEPHGHRFITIITHPGSEVTLYRFRSAAGVYVLSKDGEIRNILRATDGRPFIATLSASTTSRFLLIAQQAKDGSPAAHQHRWTPICISWRKGTSQWLPQLPLFTIVDNAWMRNIRNEGLELGDHEAPG
jgi:hypothetical protein